MKYIVNYTITNNKKGQHEFEDYTQAKEIYIQLAYNLTIKKAKLYEICNNKKRLLKKFKNKRI